MSFFSPIKRRLRRRSAKIGRTPFGRLVSLFSARMFHGGGESASEDLDLGVGLTVSLMALPGLLVSLLTFEKYGSFIRFLTGQERFDPFTATIPDEYFFIVLSLAVSAAAALWRWDSIFLDRRDFTNLVPLPVRISSIFFANLCAILFLTCCFTVVANAASAVLFPLAVVGSQDSAAVFVRFAAGHLAGVLSASVFGCLAVFALTGLLIALFPVKLFRKVSHFVRFVIVILLLTLLVTSFTVPDSLSQMSVEKAHRLALLPPFSFLGLTRTVWGRGAEDFVPQMSHAALAALAGSLFLAILGYAASFRRAFLRIPQTLDAGPAPQSHASASPLAPLLGFVLREPAQRACHRFMFRTLLRSEKHLQTVSGFLGLGLVLAASALSSVRPLHALFTGSVPREDVLSVPFILAFCMVAGVRFAFEIPADLRANWVFRLWLDREGQAARTASKCLLYVFSLAWLAPLCFFVTLAFWGWAVALLHTAILIVSTVALVEASMLRFRKLPFTCSYPPFRSGSGLTVVAYLFGFIFFTSYLAEIEHWALSDPWRSLFFLPIWTASLAATHYYRKQMLEMDKQLLFEEAPASSFW